MNKYYEKISISVDSDLYDLLREHVSQYTNLSNTQITRVLMETFLFNKVIVTEAELNIVFDTYLPLVESLGFNDFSAWIENEIHNQIYTYGDLCKNCRYIQENGFCIYNNCFVHPLSLGRSCHIYKE